MARIGKLRFGGGLAWNGWLRFGAVWRAYEQGGTVSDINHSDWCDLPLNEDSECSVCEERMEKEKAYYGALYAREHHYTLDEIQDAYSDPTERAKRDSLLRRMETA